MLPDHVYNKTFSELLNKFCAEIIRRILSMEDISATVANELCEIIQVILEKAPLLFKVSRILKQLIRILNAQIYYLAGQT